MNRPAIVALFAFIGFVIAFATALPPARSASPVAPAEAELAVPLAWIAQALSEMPFLLPAGR